MTITLTPAIIHAAGQDAGNRSMKDAGRSKWSKADYNAAAKESNRLYASVTTTTFDESTEWFDRLVKHARDNKYIGLKLLLSRLQPNSRNLQSVRNMAENIEDKRLSRDVLATIDAVANNEFKGEFRYKFHSPRRHAGQCSACGSLFSLLRQALEYHD